METTRGILLIYNVLDSPEIKNVFSFKSNFSIEFTKIILPANLGSIFGIDGIGKIRNRQYDGDIEFSEFSRGLREEREYLMVMGEDGK